MQPIDTARARDVMRTDVATLSAEDTIRSALALFEDARIGGAPVLSADGRLVGMLTLSDLARPERRREGRIALERDYVLSEPTDAEPEGDGDPAEAIRLKEDYSPAILGQELVGDWMSGGIISVAPNATLREVCKVMVQSRIHRVCVTEDGRLVGLITSFDVMRRVAGGDPPRKSAQAAGR